jgi:hypothetical protein
MIEIPVVYEGPSPNVWSLPGDNDDVNHQHFSQIFHRQIPWLFQTFQPHLKIISPKQIKDVDWFVYPVIMDEPYYQIRVLIGNYHMDYGFWNFVSDDVIEALKAKKGWIIIDATLEPMSDLELEQVLRSLEDVSEFPNDRIIINAASETHSHHPQVVNHPSFIESHYCCRHMFNMQDDTYLEGGILQRKDIHIPVANELEPPGENQKVEEFKRFCSFQMRWWKHKGSAQLLRLLDKKNCFKKGYVTADGLDDFANLYKSVGGVDLLLGTELKNSKDILDPVVWVSPYLDKSGFNIVTEAYYNEDDLSYPLITEKIWRNVSSRKPFVLIGQKHTLKKMHRLGYKTFAPFIDESYDDNTSDHSRVFQAALEAKKLIYASEADFATFLKNCEPIFNHNEKNFEKRITDTYTYFERLRSLCVN